MLHRSRRLQKRFQKGKREIKDIIAKNIRGRWQGRRTHGKSPSNLKENWWKRKFISMTNFGDVKGETESTIVAAQDQEIG
jgi:hypothetical protein